MGDRCNIVVRNGKPEGSTLADALKGAAVFYGHWSGHAMPTALARAIGRRQRWDDEGYLARIIFDEFTKGQQGQETGFGIYIGSLGDNEHPVMCVCVDAKTVTQYGRGYVSNDDEALASKAVKTWTFEQYINNKDYAS